MCNILLFGILTHVCVLVSSVECMTLDAVQFIYSELLEFVSIFAVFCIGYLVWFRAGFEGYSVPVFVENYGYCVVEFGIVVWCYERRFLLSVSLDATPFLFNFPLCVLKYFRVLYIMLCSMFECVQFIFVVCFIHRDIFQYIYRVVVSCHFVCQKMIWYFVRPHIQRPISYFETLYKLCFYEYVNI